jgi:hypothetical protein
MIHKGRVVIAGVAICILCYGPIFYFSKKDSEQCDEVVFLEGEASRDCRNVSFINDGAIAQIYYCDGTIEQVPTLRIIKVVEKEDVQ